MKAILIRQTGGPEVLKLEEVPLGKIGQGQARVKLHYAGINFIEIYQRKGVYPSPKNPPWIPGSEGSGIVEEVGPEVKDIKVGDHVAFAHQLGSYAQEIILQADGLIVLPKSISLEQGAAFPLQGMTAQYLLFEFYKIKKGDVILVQAAAGGVGLLLVQWAKHLGATVFGTVSSDEKAIIAKEAGADETILYTKTDFAAEVKKLTNGKGANYIIDGVGKETFPKDLEAIATRGHIVIFGASSGPVDQIPLSSLKAKSLTLSSGSLPNFISTKEELQMRAKAVLEGIEQGWLKLRIDRKVPLADAAEAHKALENRKTMGKVLLTIE